MFRVIQLFIYSIYLSRVFVSYSLNFVILQLKSTALSF